ncbi:hypothetical protein B0H17DRAFT_510921 [Mycena rosella]|uniref:Uncharacterized protein n=1 Tax=Mycena rosella TaxID=1033263 RepID=A0AAD7BYA1_MYCRO|nr:hypothetical protein B0H17DRAFT_510921 [Mycena rosella]
MARATAGPHSGSPGGGFRTAAREQCLQNSDLVEQLLPQITSDGMSVAQLKSARKDLLSVALTCKTLRPSAIRLLWRRLDNLVPLLSLCPSFQLTGPRYKPIIDLRGIIGSGGWDLLDRHAAHVREIEYDPGNVSISPLVQIRLAMRKCPLLPNLLRFRCILGLAPDAQILLFLSPSLLSVETSFRTTNSSDAFVELLSNECSGLLHLKLVHHLPTGISHFRQLRSLDLRDLFEPMTSTTFGMIAVLPELSSFTTDLRGWEGIDFDGLDAGSSFVRLAHLELRTTPALSRQHLPRLIPRIATTTMRSLVISP